MLQYKLTIEIGMSENLEFYIFLDNLLGYYFAGDAVTGNVVIKTDLELKAKGVMIKFEGLAKVDWSEEGKLEFMSDEKLLNSNQMLAGDGHNEMVISPGQFRYEFTFQLPSKLPSTFHSRFGKVEYILKANVIRSLFKVDFKTQKEVNIYSVVDLNQDQRLARPFKWDKLKQLIVKINKVGFYPGETAMIEVDVENCSSKAITSISLDLVQSVAYMFEGTSQGASNVIESIKREERVDPGTSFTWKVNLMIPLVQPSGGCRIIHLEYSILVSACYDGCCPVEVEQICHIKIGSRRLPSVDNVVQKEPLAIA